jgi:hypothetical protein
MICILFVFCSAIMSYAAVGVPTYPGYVSTFNPNPMFAEHPAIVLVAHNNLDGRYFVDIQEGDMIRYYDGEWWDYRVTHIIEAQAKETTTKTPLLIDGTWLSPSWVHSTVFNGEDRLVLQTCIRKKDNWTWGRLFVIAEKEKTAD